MNTLDDALLERFTRSEFGQWWRFMSTKLVLGLNAFALDWGAAVHISPHPDALGRFMGPDSASAHNIDRWGMVLGADTMPMGLEGATQYARAYAIAKRHGFVGFGVYPHWSPRPGIHLDMAPRAGRGNGGPLATWRAERLPGKAQTYHGLADIMPPGWEA